MTDAVDTAGRAVRPLGWRGALALPLASLVGLVAAALLELRVAERGLPASVAADVAQESGVGSCVYGLVLGVLAAVVLRDRDHRRFGWALGWFGVFWTLDGLAEAWVRLGLVTDHALPAMTFAVWFLLRFTALLPMTIAVLPLLFPTGRMLPGRWGTAGWLSLLVMALSALSYMLVPYGDNTGGGRLPPGTDPDPTTIHALDPVATPLVGGLQAAAIAALLVPVATVVVRYRRSTGVDRERMRWLLWGALVTGFVIAAVLVLDPGPLLPAVLFLVVALVPASMTVAVVNPRLVPIDDLLGRTALFGALAVVLVALDLAVVAALTGVLGEALDQRQVVVVVLLLSVVLYGPLRQRLWTWGRRLVLGASADPYDAVAGLASTLETTDEGTEQLAAVARAVAEAFGVGFVSVEVDRSGGERLVATYGERPDATRTLPITYRDAAVGRLVLPARGIRSRLSRRDEQLLGDLVRQAATAARTSRLAEELQESRERLVTAREEERRRIRRDLHDGLGPVLSGVVFRLESARLLVDREPASAREQLVETSRAVQDVVADVRRLVHDLRPPALDDLGLVGAVRQQAEQLTRSGTGSLDVRVEAEELGPLPAAVEVAAYRICAEALTNVVRHAAAARAAVRLAVANATLVVEVADDGAGIAEEAQAGIGLLSLRERAAELGGRSEVTCPASGGTVVRAWLPMAAAMRTGGA